MQDKQKIAYIATGVPFDNEFKERILIHKKNRSGIFETYEETINFDKQIEKIFNKHKIFLIECLTTWLGNLYQKNDLNIKKKADSIIENTLKAFINKKNKDKSSNNLMNDLYKNENKKYNYSIKNLIRSKKENKIIILVSNETGMGIVPDNKISRDYRDLLGKINQKISDRAHFVYFTCSGIPIRIK